MDSASSIPLPTLQSPYHAHQRWKVALESKTRGAEDENYDSLALPRYAVKRLYVAKHEDELTLREGEVVQVLKKMKDGET